MQIAEKYKKAYQASLEKLSAARKKMILDLDEIPGLRVFPSQANYVTVEITQGMSSRELTRRLLSDKGIFVKDLTPKMKRENRQYLRLAVRREEENVLLTDALREYLTQV